MDYKPKFRALPSVNTEEEIIGSNNTFHKQKQTLGVTNLLVLCPFSCQGLCWSWQTLSNLGKNILFCRTSVTQLLSSHWRAWFLFLFFFFCFFQKGMIWNHRLFSVLFGIYKHCCLWLFTLCKPLYECTSISSSSACLLVTLLVKPQWLAHWGP